YPSRRIRRRLHRKGGGGRPVQGLDDDGRNRNREIGCGRRHRPGLDGAWDLPETLEVTMAVDEWGFDSDRQARARDLRRRRLRLSAGRTLVSGVAVIALILGFLAPVVLVPLFYRFRPLSDPGLRTRFEALAAKAHVPIVGVFELRASAKTRRSNAAVMGFGRTRRVLVTDTLLQAFSPEEIETVLAHELAHQRNRDPIRGFVGGSLVSLTILAAAAWTYASVYPSFGVRSPGDIAGLPLLVALFSLFAIPFRPAELFASRSREGRADRFSLQLT